MEKSDSVEMKKEALLCVKTWIFQDEKITSENTRTLLGSDKVLNGREPARLEKVLGRYAKKDLACGQAISQEDLQPENYEPQRDRMITLKLTSPELKRLRVKATNLSKPVEEIAQEYLSDAIEVKSKESSFGAGTNPNSH
ncbi:MAG: hypothetical protein GC193_12040 [Cryomorphaceae bacterium]|nr:hypothetical protein [Cryomorphaceae bacterium]